jgi:DNA-binding response OmpR family regulator
VKILVVDDDLELAGLIGYALRQAGYLVVDAADGPSALAAFEREAPSLVILDVNLPRLSGLEVCRQIRAGGSATPIMMLTVRNAEEDQVQALDLGADDYLTKPFSPRELVARVHAILRRVDRSAEAKAAADPAVRTLRLGKVALEPATRRATLDGEPVHLTPTEFDILALLGDKPGVVFTREKMLAEIWGYRDGFGARTVDSHVQALRRKLGAGVIRTVHGVGYAAGDDELSPRAVGPGVRSVPGENNS